MELSYLNIHGVCSVNEMERDIRIGGGESKQKTIAVIKGTVMVLYYSDGTGFSEKGDRVEGFGEKGDSRGVHWM